MPKVRILNDYSFDDTPPVKPGTVVFALLDTTEGGAWYFHPDTGEDWLSFDGEYELVDEQEDN